MAFLGGTFDATQVEPLGEYTPLTPGEYTVQIISSEMVPTKAGTGQMLKIEMEVIEGEQAGRKLIDRLNLDNPNATAVEIAQRTLSAICHAVGKLSIADSNELHMLPMIAVVKVDPPRDQYGASNSIKTYKKMHGNAGAVAGGFANKAFGKPAVAAPEAKTAASAPWKRNAA